MPATAHTVCHANGREWSAPPLGSDTPPPEAGLTAATPHATRHINRWSLSQILGGEAQCLPQARRSVTPPLPACRWPASATGCHQPASPPPPGQPGLGAWPAATPATAPAFTPACQASLLSLRPEGHAEGFPCFKFTINFSRGGIYAAPLKPPPGRLGGAFPSNASEEGMSPSAVTRREWMGSFSPELVSPPGAYHARSRLAESEGGH